MNVKLWSFFKRTNSLDLPPAASVPLEFSDVTLKSGTSVLEPVIRIKWDGTTSLSLVGRSYAYIEEFLRYYFVQDIVFEDRCWNIKLTVDVLGSYRTQILQAQLPVIRATGTSDGSPTDVIIPDAKFPPGLRHNEKVWSYSLDNWGSSPSSGFYTIGLIGTTSAATDEFYHVGGSSFAIATPAQLRAIIKEAYAQMITANTTVVDTVAAAVGNLAKSIFNPGQFISNVTWFPIQPPTNGNTINHFGLGAYTLGTSIDPDQQLTVMLNGVDSRMFHIDLSDLVDSDGTRNLYIEPYASYYLEFWPFGVFPIDGRTLVAPDTTGIDILLTVDFITGAARFEAYRSTAAVIDPTLSGSLLCTGSGQLGVQVPIGGASTHDVQAVQAMTGTLTSIAALSAGDFAAAGGLVSGALSAVVASAPSAVTSGACGGFAGVSTTVKVRRTRFLPVMTDYDHAGKAYSRIKRLADLVGFVQCWDGHVQLQPWSTAQERDEVERMLREGIYV